MSDVSAVVFTLGEQTTGRALASLKAQTLPVEEVVVVEGVRPFHRAFNIGAERVRTPFFVQVDADMILDPGCVEALRNAMGPRIGIAVGALRDPLIGRIAGVKMFRRSCLEAVPLRDVAGAATNRYLALGRRGWSTQCLTGHGQPTTGRSLGAHRPDYTVGYAFGTYYVLGRNYAHRGDARALRWRYSELRRSAHPLAPVARIAMAQGIFGTETHDFAKPRPGLADSTFLGRLAGGSEDGSAIHGRIRRMIALATEPLFEEFRELGASLRASSDQGLRAYLHVLGAIDHSRSLLAEVALGAGTLASAPREMPVALEALAEGWTALDQLETATVTGGHE